MNNSDNTSKLNLPEEYEKLLAEFMTNMANLMQRKIDTSSIAEHKSRQ